MKTAVSISNTDEKQIFISRIKDAVRLSSLRHQCCYVGFLNDAQIFQTEKLMQDMHFDTYAFYGGYKDAQRRLFCASPDLEIYEEAFPIVPIGFRYRKADVLTHRDFLGTLMSLGIQRETVGDILTEEGKAVLFVKSDVADYIKGQVFKVGGAGVTQFEPDLSRLRFQQKFEEKTFIVASPRLDAVTAAYTGLSREKTAKLILSGLVSLNYAEQKNVSHVLKEEDIISVRGKGKFKIQEFTGGTKKGRLRLLVKLFR